MSSDDTLMRAALWPCAVFWRLDLPPSSNNLDDMVCKVLLLPDYKILQWKNEKSRSRNNQIWNKLRGKRNFSSTVPFLYLDISGEESAAKAFASHNPS